ncbi:MAG: TIGR03915 family putative DNA repair protein [Tannerella sp.]|jgi:probable DNA metabolism protein|nr:TIGR03915 family putative DNA repair protein [Tannerella sp.]
MTLFFYDKTFEGLLCAVFDAYSLNIFPEKLLQAGDIPPLFAETVHTVVTGEEHANRVWRALEKKVQKNVRNMLFHVWLSELDGSDELLFRYLCKIFAANRKIEYNFGDADILEVEKIARKVSHEAQYIRQFVRFRKAADDIFFAPINPIYNALPLAVGHFADRFADQQWVIYDLRRKYGYFYDLHTVKEITFAGGDHLLSGKLDESLMAEDEKLFQDLWKNYFKAMTIKERINPRLHKKNMPVRFWQYLTEKSGNDAMFPMRQTTGPPT